MHYGTHTIGLLNSIPDTTMRRVHDHSDTVAGSFNSTFHFEYFIYIADDFNRVVLKMLPGQDHSDYINASYADVIREHTTATMFRISLQIQK